MESKKIIEFKKVNFSFTKDKILCNINWTIKEGDFWALIGPNGGGKSTLAKLLVGLLKPSSGEILRDNALKIGFVPQNTFLNRDFPITALDVVLMGFLKPKFFSGFLPKEAKSIALEILNKLSLKDSAYKKIGELSGGQRQRVLIARALCGNPNLLVLDEPTASVDKRSQKEIYELLQEINKEKTIIIISHDVSVLLGYAKKVLHINKEIIVHNLPTINLESKDEHFCEVEMLLEYWGKESK
ncbi:MAG: metal ABC transporter ATP-binding protein [Helicobacter sp.]|nr:metal ABC transporter ATP-binding protein [Helicobacteraceae bacterium]MDY3114166.1 metal ABC transporter ATP-binding protein [Helicobacter sp.]